MISLLLVLVTLLGILPVTSFAAPTLEEAMAEVDVYARSETLDWLTMNGSVKEQHYTYYKYESVQTGQLKEIPAYCVDPRLYGVPALVPEGTPIKYTAPDTVSDPKVCGIIANGYPHESLSVLKVIPRRKPTTPPRLLCGSICWATGLSTAWASTQTLTRRRLSGCWRLLGPSTPGAWAGAASPRPNLPPPLTRTWPTP